MKFKSLKIARFFAIFLIALLIPLSAEAQRGGGYYCDDDKDGYYDKALDGNCGFVGCTPPTGCRAALGNDCNDLNSSINPGAVEIWYNGTDQNCDGKNDYDRDMDGYVHSSFDSQAGGSAPSTGDCNDNNSSVHPDHSEIMCNGIDDNCNGNADEDKNTDGDPVSFCNGDCNDLDPNRYPGNIESLCNGFDENCNGNGDDDRNNDGDPVSLCQGDCNDNDATRYPGNPEVTCNGLDENCNGNGDDDRNTDGDPVSLCNGDCNDDDSGIYPGNAEVCDGIDNNCNGLIDDGLIEDLDADGYTVCEGDCNDLDERLNPATVWFLDGDNDNYGTSDINLTIIQCNQPQGYVQNDLDCNDNDPSVTLFTYWQDSDGDGYGTNHDITGFGIAFACSPPTGFVDNMLDCQDFDASINPDAIEVTCNDIDDNCNGFTDDNPNIDGDSMSLCEGDCNDNDPSVTLFTYWQDSDGDGYGTNHDITGFGIAFACSPPTGFVDNMLDCQDFDASINPDAIEVTCNDIDENCNGATDDDRNADNDSMSLCEGDCDDNNASITLFTYWQDGDGDGYGTNHDITGTGTAFACSPPAGFVSNSLDCMDTFASINPDAPEICIDQLDNDCDGLTDGLDGDCFPKDYYCDGDSDGVAGMLPSGQCAGGNCAPQDCQMAVGTDCDDTSSNIFPGAPEVCDAIDNNCNDIVDEGDADGNGVPDCIDPDGDAITNDLDNCPDIANADQADFDEDGIGDLCDNCVEVFNPDQRDTNADEDDNLFLDGIQHYGNICDGDFDNSGVVEIKDFILWRPFAGQQTNPTNEDMDMNGNGAIWTDDFIIWRGTYGKMPGPGVTEQ